MILFYTNSTKHLASKIKVNKGKFEIRRFSDGEIHVKVEQDVKNKKVWVLASTLPPADNILELIFLLDVLKREKAKINLLIPYFGYARQDRLLPGECFSSKIMCDWLRKSRLRNIAVIDLHTHRIRKFLKYKNMVPFEIYAQIAKKMDVVVAPDKGALPNARSISKACRIPLASMEKIRPEKEKIKMIKIKGSVKGKKVLIVDDMISTGSTIVEAAKIMMKKGAKEVSVIATHGIFSDDAIKKINKSRIKKVYVTNTIHQKSHSKKIKVIDISDYLKNIMS